MVDFVGFSEDGSRLREFTRSRVSDVQPSASGNLGSLSMLIRMISSALLYELHAPE
jgi:hypothetical protein